MRLEMNLLEEDQLFRQVAGTHLQLAGAVAHLRSLGDGLFRTRHVIHRAVAACEQSKQLLAQIELAERKLHRG